MEPQRTEVIDNRIQFSMMKVNGQFPLHKFNKHSVVIHLVKSLRKI